METHQTIRTWAEIDLDALGHNYRALRAQMGPDARFLGVVKADSYGHGAVHISRELEALGASYVAISSIDEAQELRRAGIRLPLLHVLIHPEDGLCGTPRSLRQFSGRHLAKPLAPCHPKGCRCDLFLCNRLLT